MMDPITLQKWKKYSCCQAEFYTTQMQALLEDIDNVMRNPSKVLKDDPTSTVVVIKVDERCLVIKRSNTKDFTHFLRRLFAQSRAKKNWENANKLLKIGIRTFYPVAFLEKRWGFFKGHSYFICTYIEGIDAIDYFSQKTRLEPSWKLVTKNIGKMIDLLATHWISHRDLNLSNIILVENEPWLIDLDGMRQHYCRLGARRGAKREWDRFMKNCQDAPVNPECISLFKSLLRDY